jgi:hypothetical protein
MRPTRLHGEGGLPTRLLIVANNTPLPHAVVLGPERIYVLPAGFPCALDTPPRGALARWRCMRSACSRTVGSSPTSSSIATTHS